MSIKISQAFDGNINHLLQGTTKKMADIALESLNYFNSHKPFLTRLITSDFFVECLS